MTNYHLKPPETHPSLAWQEAKAKETPGASESEKTGARRAVLTENAVETKQAVMV